MKCWVDETILQNHEGLTCLSVHCSAKYSRLLRSGNSNWKGRLSSVDLTIKVACFVKKYVMFAISKGAELHGGQMYLALSPVRVSFQNLQQASLLSCLLFCLSHIFLHIENKLSFAPGLIFTKTYNKLLTNVLWTSYKIILFVQFSYLGSFHNILPFWG